jgi:alkylmercury lyase
MRTVEIAERLTCRADILDATDQRVQLALFRLLARGEPVEAGCLADDVSLETATVVARLGRWHGVHLDATGRVVAFQGLSLAQTPHRLHVEGRTLYAWCAWDTLFLPELIGRRAAIESTCPITGETVSLRVGPTGPTDVAPPEAALSLLLPGSQCGDDTIKSFCSLIHFFASRHAAEAWTARHPGTFVTSIDDGFDIGRRANAAQWGDALRHSPT